MREREPQAVPIRVRVKTDGLWRAEQVARTMLAVDGIVVRVAVASSIGEACEAYDWAIRTYGMLGFLGGKPETWEKPKTPSDLELRSALSRFVSLMRQAGIEVTFSELGAKYTVLADDLYQIVPTSYKAEIESIRMASPGSWSLLFANAMKSDQAVRLLEKVFDAMFFHSATKRKKMAEAREAEARAAIAKAQSREAQAKADTAIIRARREEMSLVLDCSVAVDSLVLTLQNAGFDTQQTLKFRAKLDEDVRTVALQKSLGLLKRIAVERLPSAGAGGTGQDHT